jgi:hypothetical protein
MGRHLDSLLSLMALLLYALGATAGVVLLIRWGARLFPGIWPVHQRRPFDWETELPELRQPSHVHLIHRRRDPVYWRGA